jgi:predicted phosphodiesterase
VGEAIASNIVEKTMNFIHISDIHFGNSDYSTRRAQDVNKTKELCNFIKEAGFTDIDSLIITGDLIYARGDDSRGKKNLTGLKLYIKEFMDMFSLGKDKLFIVPGNHDVQRSPSRETICTDIDRTYNYQTGLDGDKYNYLSRGFEPFASFYKTLCNEDYKIKTRLLTIGEFCYLLINTSLISAKDNEDGSLIIDINQIRSELQKSNGNIVIALGHHSLGCIRDDEKDQLEQLFCEYNVKLYLCGHHHKMLIDRKKSWYQCQCGTLMARRPDGSDTDMLVYAGSIDKNGVGNIMAIKYDRRFNMWMPDSGISYYHSRRTDGIVRINQPDMSDDIELIEKWLNEQRGILISKKSLMNFINEHSFDRSIIRKLIATSSLSVYDNYKYKKGSAL